MAKAFCLRSFFSVRKIFGQISSLFGLKGAVVGSLIVGASSVAESFVIDHQTAQQQPLALPPGINTDLRLLDAQIKNAKDKKVADFNQKLENISREINPHPPLKDISKSVNSTQYQVRELLRLEGGIFKVLAKIDEFDGLLKKELKEKENELKAKENELKEKKMNVDKKTADASHALSKVNQMIQIAAVSFEIYNKHQNDQALLKAIRDAIDLNNKQLEDLRRYEQKIYQTISPTIQKIRI